VSFEAFALLGLLALVLVAGFVASVAGTFAGIEVMCSSDDAGNLCGLWGVFGAGPLVAGIALWLFGPVCGRRMRR